MKRLSSFKLIVLGFAAVIFVGALLLMLPVSSVSGTQTPFHEALFTSVSAVCVTGLVVQDTGSYWSSFGQAVILLLIQTGGLGVITVAVSFAILSGRKNFAHAAQYNAGCNFCTENRRYCPPDQIQRTGYIIY